MYTRLPGVVHRDVTKAVPSRLIKITLIYVSAPAFLFLLAITVATMLILLGQPEYFPVPLPRPS